MYNAYVTERYTKNILLVKHNAEINAALKKAGCDKELALAYEFNPVPNDHEIFSAKIQPGANVWDIQATTFSPDTINTVEVKATGVEDTSSNYHNAELVVIYSLDKAGSIDVIIKYRPTDKCADTEYITLDILLTASQLGDTCIIVDPVPRANIRPFNASKQMSLLDNLNKK